METIARRNVADEFAVQRAGDHHVRIHRGVDHAGALDEIEHAAGVDGERRRADRAARPHHPAEGAGFVLRAGRQLQAVPRSVVLGGRRVHSAAPSDGPGRRRCARRPAARGRDRTPRRRASSPRAGRGRNRPRPRASFGVGVGLLHAVGHRPQQRPPDVSGSPHSASAQTTAQACSGSDASLAASRHARRPSGRAWRRRACGRRRSPPALAVRLRERSGLRLLLRPGLDRLPAPPADSRPCAPTAGRSASASARWTTGPSAVARLGQLPARRRGCAPSNRTAPAGSCCSPGTQTESNNPWWKWRRTCGRGSGRRRPSGRGTSCRTRRCGCRSGRPGPG